MEAKVFEVRDRGSNYSVLGVRHLGETDKEQWLLDRVGLTIDTGYPVQLTELESGETHRDLYKWHNQGRTLMNAHDHIVKNWSNLSTGELIDIEFLLGEVAEPKQSAYKG